MEAPTCHGRGPRNPLDQHRKRAAKIGAHVGSQGHMDQEMFNPVQLGDQGR